jgi:hypothetical protein
MQRYTIITLALFAAACGPSPEREPARGPAGHHHAMRGGPPAPPPEAFAACAGANEGSVCSIDDGERVMQGTCAAPPDAERLACRPNGPPPNRR